MPVSLEPTLCSWRIYVQRRVDWQSVSSAEITQIQRTFKDLGFTIVLLPSEYYNPTAKSRFIVKHLKPSAMTLWRLQWYDQYGGRIEIEQQ